MPYDYHFDYMSILTECAVDMNRADFLCLSEAAQLQVTNEELTGMFKFITDKYNSLDFQEIERSAGDISRFKYTGMIRENAEMLSNIYESSPDPGAKKYMEVLAAVMAVMNHLHDRRDAYKTLYQTGNGLVQLLYVSLVSACLFSVGVLVSNTIRFVTTEQDTDCQVMFDEIPGTMKHIHLKNVMSAAGSIGEFNKLLDRYTSATGKQSMHESVEAIAIGAAITIGVIYLIPKILVLIREIIYSIYLGRVKASEMLALQVDLINTNIESLEAGRGNKKVIARQRKIIDKLSKWQNRIAVKNDTVNSMVKMQKARENQALRIDRNSPIVQDPDSFSSGDIML